MNARPLFEVPEVGTDEVFPYFLGTWGFWARDFVCRLRCRSPAKQGYGIAARTRLPASAFPVVVLAALHGTLEGATAGQPVEKWKSGLPNNGVELPSHGYSSAQMMASSFE